MMTLVMYDITDTQTRSKFIKRLQHYGLYRLQKSVFTGFINLETRIKLSDELDSYISSPKDSIIIIPICQTCKESIITIGNAALPTKKDFTFI